MTLKFPTTSTQKLRLAHVVVAMQQANLDERFVAAANELASADQGAFELMELWFDATEQSDRDEALADIQELLDEAEELPAHPAERSKVPHDHLEHVARQVLAHKQKLRDLIARHGGVSEVARRAGIPQPSLSRMLNSAAMPRRTTLYKLANAMGASDAEVVADWIR